MRTPFKRIPLQNGLNALVDASDYPLVSQFKWLAVTQKSKYATRFICCSFEYLKNRKYIKTYMHRFLMKAKDGQIIDHINGNPLDNRRKNLRFCDSYQNAQNRRKQAKQSSSKYKGVSWRKTKNNWQASIIHRGKNHIIGYFTSEKAAARAYNKEAKRLHGAFALLNRIERKTP